MVFPDRVYYEEKRCILGRKKDDSCTEWKKEEE